MARIVKAAEERREEIVETADLLFRRHGYANCSVEMIIREIGIAEGTYYHYFKSRQVTTISSPGRTSSKPSLKERLPRSSRSPKAWRTTRPCPRCRRCRPFWETVVSAEATVSRLPRCCTYPKTASFTNLRVFRRCSSYPRSFRRSSNRVSKSACSTSTGRLKPSSFSSPARSF
ncbi:MAG: TetR/AcrR family transcriptional regulator [Thioclava marina]|nr:TetR/AcrR family transcriptional regulator [Thioclava marina]